MSKPLPRFYRRQLALEDAQKLGRILIETGDALPPTTVAKATLAGDTRRLRGIPCVAIGVGGASPGTAPHLVDYDR